MLMGIAQPASAIHGMVKSDALIAGIMVVILTFMSLRSAVPQRFVFSRFMLGLSGTQAA